MTPAATRCRRRRRWSTRRRPPLQRAGAVRHVILEEEPPREDEDGAFAVLRSPPSPREPGGCNLGTAVQFGVEGSGARGRAGREVATGHGTDAHLALVLDGLERHRDIERRGRGTSADARLDRSQARQPDAAATASRLVAIGRPVLATERSMHLTERRRRRSDTTSRARRAFRGTVARDGGGGPGPARGRRRRPNAAAPAPAPHPRDPRRLLRKSRTPIPTPTSPPTRSPKLSSCAIGPPTRASGRAWTSSSTRSTSPGTRGSPRRRPWRCTRWARRCWTRAVEPGPSFVFADAESLFQSTILPRWPRSPTGRAASSPSPTSGRCPTTSRKGSSSTSPVAFRVERGTGDG